MHRGNGEKWIVVRVLPPRMAWPAAAKYSALRGLALAYRSSASRTAEARSWFTRKTVVAMRDTCAENRVARWGVSQFWGLRGGVWQDANRRSSALITKGSLQYRAYPAKANSPDWWTGESVVDDCGGLATTFICFCSQAGLLRGRKSTKLTETLVVRS